MEVIARIRTDFPDKFGIPRQSGLVSGLSGRIVFEKKYRNPESLRGLEEFSHLWLIWGFSENENKNWSPTVRPPRLGGNKRVGVFATRSPFRPNGLGLSCVRLDRIERTKTDGEVLYVLGADMVDGSPIYDIKPYIPISDCHTDASGGFSEKTVGYSLEVSFPQELLKKIGREKADQLIEILAEDPRPSYQNDPKRVYGLKFAGYEIKFRVDGTGLIVVAAEFLG